MSNGRPIVCLGSILGDIAIYYLDDEKELREQRGGPTLVKRFSFAERGMRVEDDADRSDCEQPTAKTRLSFLSHERSHFNPHTEYHHHQNESLDYQGIRPDNKNS